MAVLNISKAAKLVGKSKPTLYAYIKSGKLSKTEKGIDSSELLRVFGKEKCKEMLNEPLKNNQNLFNEIKHYQDLIERLEKQLQESKDRENRLLAMVERLQTVLECQNKPQQTTLERIVQLFKS